MRYTKMEIPRTPWYDLHKQLQNVITAQINFFETLQKYVKYCILRLKSAKLFAYKSA